MSVCCQRWPDPEPVATARLSAPDAAGTASSGEKAPPVRPEPEAPRLPAGVQLERYLELNASHHYMFALERGHALHATVLQKNLDIVARVFDPQERLQLVVDSPNGPHGFETVAVIAQQTGDHRLEITALEQASGDYELRVLSLTAVDEKSWQRARAVADYAAAERLRADGGPKALVQASRLYASACRAFELGGEQILQARCERRQGQLELRAHRFQDAATHMEASRELYDLGGEDWEKAPLYNDLGQIYRLDGAPARARELFEEARRAAAASGNREALGGAFNNLGVVAAELGEMQGALAAYEKALSIWRELRDERRQATLEHNIGVFYLDLDRVSESLPFLQQALMLHRRSRDRSLEALTLAALGWAHHRLGDEQAALDLYDRALTRLEHTADGLSKATILDRLGTVYFERRRYPEALQHYRRALASVGESDLERAYIELNLGSVEWIERRPEAAVASFEAALGIFSDQGVLQGQADALAMLSRVARQERRFDAAMFHLEHSLQIVESIRGRLQSQWLRNAYLAVRYDQYRDQVELLMELERERPGQGYARQAFEASQRARGRGISESLTEAFSEVRATAAPELVERERALRARINGLERRRLKIRISPIEARAVDRQLNDLLLQYERLQGDFRAQHPEPLDEVEPPSLEEIQDQILDSESLLLAYFLGQRESYLWAISKESFNIHVLPAGSELDELARRLRVAVPQQHLPGFADQTRQVVDRLSRMLLEPVADRLAGQHLIFVPDGALHTLPFAYLRHPRLVDVPLQREHSSTILPSLSMLPLIRRDRADRGEWEGEVAMVADAVFDRADPRFLRPPRGEGEDPRSVSRSAEDLPPIDVRLRRLPAAKAEAASILELTSGDTLVATGFEATREWVMQAPLEHYRIVHFATHAILDHRHPALSSIVLSLWDETGKPRDGFLRAHELFDLRLNADLVVLSACSTALGQEVRGEGFIGLAHGFFYAGAASALVSLWQIEDEATSELMKIFYSAMLEDGLSAASALRQAQDVMSQHPRWSAPRHWAGFILVGEWR